jgi:hypothetical protein
MNNLFCSPTLCETLLDNSTFVLGTVRPNRIGFPTSLVEESSILPRGQWSFRQKEKMVAYLFVDRHPVYFLSTFYYPSQLDTLERRGTDGQKLEFQVPLAVTTYNSTRCGVDTLDQLQSYYSLGRKSRRWWPRLAWWLIDAAILNAHRLYEIKNEEKISARDFRTMLMHELAGDSISSQERSSMGSSRTKSKRENGHHLVLTSTKRDCCVCSTRKKRRVQSNFMCVSCNVHVCASDCYDTHRREWYVLHQDIY